MFSAGTRPRDAMSAGHVKRDGTSFRAQEKMGPDHRDVPRCTAR
jgi:hypothetical protein